MNPRALRDNTELSEYLARLAATLDARSRPELAEQVAYANRFSTGSPSEFLHEVQFCLKLVRDKGFLALTTGELQNVDAVLCQIEAAFRGIGGA